MNEITVTSAEYVQNPDGSNANSIKSTINSKTVYVPVDTDNRHYQAILDWVADGNTIQDAS